MRRTAAIVFLLVGVVCVMQAQEVSEDVGSKRLWVTAKVYPSFTGNAGWYQFNEFYTSFQHRVTLSGGIELTHELKKEKWYIETGFIVFDWGFKEVGKTEGDPSLHTYDERYLYATVPVTAIYRCNRFYFGIGVNASCFLKHYHIKDGNKSVSNKPQHEAKLNALNYWLFGLNAKVGMRMKINDKIIFRPELYGMLGQTHKGFPKIWQPYGLYSVGIGFGFDYQFK